MRCSSNMWCAVISIAVQDKCVQVCTRQWLLHGRRIGQVDSSGEIEQQVCRKFGKFLELMSPAAGSGEVGAEKFCHRTENWK